MSTPIEGDASVARTVLFSDVVRSTAFIDERGEQPWLAMVGDHARTIRTTSGRHGGDIASFLGDGFMVIFEDPSEAISCAFELQANSIGEELPGLRIGLDHGEIHPFEHTWWIGRTIHIASRLTEMCRSGDVVVSDRCLVAARQELSGPHVDTRLVAIRGLGEPCLVHAVAPPDAEPGQPSDRPMASRVP
jgi:class 3 adenylate cyclase